MRIKHNSPALNTNNKLKINKDKATKSLEKLSSGYKINRAGDDAAGLAISEKMRGQIRGLDMAAKNIQDGISVVQTADGGLQEITEIIQRQRELIVQGTNETNTDKDKQIIENEINQLTEELNRIANQTEFNTINLLARTDYQVLADRSGQTVNVTTTGPFPYKVINNETYTYFLPKGTTEIPISVQSNTITTIDDHTNNDTSMSIITLPDGSQGFNDYEKNEHIHTKTTTIYDKTTGRTLFHDPRFTELDITKNSKIDSVSFGTNLTPTGILNGEYPDFGMIDDRTIYIEINGVKQTLKDFTLISSSINGNSISAVYSKDGIEVEKLISTDGVSFKAEFKVKNNSGNNDSQINVSTNYSSKFQSFYSISSNSGVPIGQTASNTEIPDSGTVFELSNGLVDYNFSFLSGGSYVKPNSLTTGDTLLTSLNPIIPSWGSNDFDNGDTLEFGIELNSFNFKKDVYLLTDKETSTIDSVVKTVTTTIKDIDYIPRKLVIQMGANENQHSSIPLFNVRPDELGINNIGLLPPNTPDDSLSKLDKGLEKVTNYRSTYGAIQNRLENAYNFVVNTSENFQAAESRIRDTDMAKEMMNFTKDNILIQAAQIMLAQSNKQPEVVLQLLQ